MAFNLKPFKVLVSLSKEALDAALIPLRIRAAKTKAEGEVIKLEEKMLALEAEINKLCAEKELNFELITDRVDTYELTERKLNQIKKLVEQLFPTTA